MKIVIEVSSRKFANELAILGKKYNCPVVKNANCFVVLYMVSEAKCNIMLEKIYNIVKNSSDNPYNPSYMAYDYIKVKRFTPILDIKYKGKCGN